MEVPPLYLSATASWLTLQALPLLLTPKIIITLFAPDEHHASSTERYLCRLLALALFTIATTAIFIPAQYTSLPLTTFHVSTFIYIYSVYLGLTTSIGTEPPNTTGLILGLIGYGVLSVMGIWMLVFGGVPSHLSKRTGADKRMSGWPFGNTEAYNKKRDYAAVGQKAR